MGNSAHAVGAGKLQVSVVEGRNFAIKEMGRGTLDSCVELLIGDKKVRTETARDTLNPSWLTDFNFIVPWGVSHLWVSVLDEDQFFGREVLIGRAVVAISDLVGCGKRVLWIHVKNLDNINVGEVCLILRYTDHQSSGDRESNPPGLKALVSSSEASSSDNMKYTTEDGLQWRSVEVLKDLELEQLIPPLIQTEGVGPTDPSISSKEIVNSTIRAEEDVTDNTGKEGGEGAKRRWFACQYKMVAFTGVMVTVLMAFILGNNQKKRSQDPQKMNKEKDLTGQDQFAWTFF